MSDSNHRFSFSHVLPVLSLRSKVLPLSVSLIAISLVLFSCSKHEPIEVEAPVNPGSVHRGAELARGLASCGFCHGEQASPRALLSGGRAIVDSYGEVRSANITPDKTGIRGWKDFQIADAIRSGLTPEGSYLSTDAHKGFGWISDQDLYSIIAYIKSVPPIRNEVERRELGLMDGYSRSLLERRREMKGYVPDLEKRDKVAYGQYLVNHVARCGTCHNTPESLFNEEAYLRGGRSVLASKHEMPAPDISSSKVYGIGDWSAEEIVRYLKTGQTADKRFVNPEGCPVSFYKNASDTDLEAIAEYLRSL
jgi:D-sorbitol dehydrogenase (acceptor)